MVEIQVKYIDDLEIPARGSEDAAGYDIFATSDPRIAGSSDLTFPSLFWKSIDYIEYETNLFIAPEERDHHTIILPRSSISKYNLLLANSIGLVDNDYRGMIKFRFKYIFQPKDLSIFSNQIVGTVDFEKIYKKGDKVGQILAQKTIPIKFKSVKELDVTQRNSGGFGSTGK